MVPKIIDKIQPFPAGERWRVLELLDFSGLYGMKNPVVQRPVECLNNFYSWKMFTRAKMSG